jgi:hypothetical protein
MPRVTLAALVLVLLAAPAWAAGSDAEVSRALFLELLEPITDVARDISASGIAVRGLPAQDGPEQRFFNAVGDRLLAEGFDVWVLESAQPVPDGVLALDLQLTASEIDYPQQTRSFLGVGQARVQRRVALGAHMRLTNPGEGRILYNAEPVRVQREWMSFREAEGHAAERPDWMGAQAIQDMRARNPWWQRTLVIGIATGVAVIYFSGAN